MLHTDVPVRYCVIDIVAYVSVQVSPGTLADVFTCETLLGVLPMAAALNAWSCSLDVSLYVYVLVMYVVIVFIPQYE